jgi:hypothetical protein
MAERHEYLKSRALSTLLNKHDRKSLMTDGFGDFCFGCKPFICKDCNLEEQHIRFVGHPAVVNHLGDLERAPAPVNASQGLVV